MVVRFLYPAAVKGVHIKAAVRHIDGHTHNPAQVNISAARVFDNASSGNDI